MPSPGRLERAGVVLRDPRPDDAAALVQAFVDDPGLGSTVRFEHDPDLAWWRTALADEEGYRRRGEGMNPVVTDASDAPLGTTGLLRPLGLIRLQLTTTSDNHAMPDCARRAGFAAEGVLRAYTFERGRPVDNAMLAVVP